MKRNIILILAIAMISYMFVVYAECNNNNLDTITIISGSSGQPTLPALEALQWVYKNIEEKANGKIKFNWYPQGQLGDNSALITQVMDGTIQMCTAGTSTFSLYTNLLEAFQVPFLLNSYEKEYIAIKSPELQRIYDVIEKEYNVKILAMYDCGMRHIANNRRPIKSVSDLEGLKLRVVPTDILIEAFNMLGASPIPMNYGEIYSALQNKVIDGEEVNLTTVYSEKHYEVLKYFSIIGLYPFSTPILINLDFYNSLDPEIQKLFVDEFKKGEDYCFKDIILKSDNKALNEIKKSGVKVLEIKNVEEFRQILKPLASKYASMDPLIKDFIEMAYKIKD